MTETCLDPSTAGPCCWNLDLINSLADMFFRTHSFRK